MNLHPRQKVYINNNEYAIYFAGQPRPKTGFYPLPRR